ncbi:OmpA family protein [Flavobacterium sp. 3HN19-14]|uniref:OmpA family protein n=1 Tax=Flavobacterium sp. 3HN19-14 TaxID=3448133 RepID=UPI003EE0F02D
MDVFVSDIKNDTYSEPLNVGLPLNSGYDDFAFNIDSDTKEGYFSSNRPGGKGADDIYWLKETKPLIIENCKQFIAGVITDIDTKLPLENAKVLLQDENKKEIEIVNTSADGKFSFAVACLKSYTVSASKEAYSKDSRTLKLKKERNKINDASMTLKSDAAVKKEADIAAQKQKEADDAAAKKEKELAVIGKKEKVEKIIAAEKDIVKDKDRLLIKTEPIYFDYDLWYIRKESKPILNKVIALMKKYPDMVVEIGSHTDVRGNNQYNLDLSSRRAASTLDYFLEQGIPANRISAKGYGETVPIIKCVPDHSCSEEQHELNRRSEFVIKSL